MFTFSLDDLIFIDNNRSRSFNVFVYEHTSSILNEMLSCGDISFLCDDSTSDNYTLYNLDNRPILSKVYPRGKVLGKTYSVTPEILLLLGKYYNIMSMELIDVESGLECYTYMTDLKISSENSEIKINSEGFLVWKII